MMIDNTAVKLAITPGTEHAGELLKMAESAGGNPVKITTILEYADGSKITLLSGAITRDDDTGTQFDFAGVAWAPRLLTGESND